MCEADGEVLFQCPYDNTHMVRLKRMPYHLMVCRKNFPNSNLVQCPFNALHEVPKAELRYHISICCDKNRIEQEAVAKAPGLISQYKGCTEVPEYKNHQENMPQREDWETEAYRDPKVFVWGESYKYDPSFIGPDDPNARAEKDKDTVTLYRQQFTKTMLTNGSDASWTRLPCQPPKVLEKN